MTPAVIGALSTAIVAVLGAVGALLHSMQTRSQVNPRQSQLQRSNTPTASYPDQQV